MNIRASGIAITLVVAASKNNVIGVQGDLPWKLSEDLRRFKRITMGKPIVMGRLTWESIGRALPGRQNIVISRQSNFPADGCDVVTSPAAALAAAGEAEEIMIIGGAQIYDLFLPKANRLHLTRVDTQIDGGDAFFSPLGDDWTLIEREAHAADDDNEYAVEFQTYERQISI